MASSTSDSVSGLFKGAEPGEPPRFRYRHLYYITHIDNISSILENGVLSHQQILDKGIKYAEIYKREVVNLRKNKRTPDGKSLWQYANFYMQPRNPMLYLVKINFGSANLAVLSCYVLPAVETPRAWVTDGNAANGPTKFFPASEFFHVLDSLKDVDGLEYWKEEDGSKRRIMAETLVPDRYPQEHIHTILVSNQKTKEKVERIVAKASIHPQVVVDERTFFDPDYEHPLTKTLTLVRGDMFFSGLQTLTVSVNTMGVMGKGLASRAKYQFPDVYVKYQDACRSKTLRMGRPVLYKREGGLDTQLADFPSYLKKGPNHNTWFLLFATKDDWRRPAVKEGIIKGLEWLVKNYESLEIKSLALPALGCGLGNLEWSEMGPILCRYLAKLKIPVQLYIPAEKPVPEKQLTKEYLLGVEDPERKWF